MKKLMLLLIMVGFGMNAQTYSPTKNTDWSEIATDFRELYSIATELSEQTENVVVSDNVISFVLDSGTISLEQKRDKSKSVEFYNYSLMSTAGKVILLKDKAMAASVVDGFASKCAILKEKLKENSGAAINDVLSELFGSN